jgi:hypothetical protein
MRKPEPKPVQAMHVRAHAGLDATGAAHAPPFRREPVQTAAGPLAALRRSVAQAVTAGMQSMRRPIGAGGNRRDSRGEGAFLSDAVDAPDLERRQRTWERDESNAYSLSGWP